MSGRPVDAVTVYPAGEQADRGRANAAGRAGYQHLLAAGRDRTPVLQRVDAKCGRIAGRTDRHRILKRERVGQPHQPFGLHPLVSRVSAPFGLRHAPAIGDDLVAGLPVRRARFHHRASNVDSGHHRQAAGDAPLAGDRQAVLVVQRREGDFHQNVVVGSSASVDLPEIRHRFAVYDHRSRAP